MPRSVKEWIGKTDDSMPPQSVRLRIFERHKGICHLTKLKIMPGDAWQLDHIEELADGGENRESNLAPALVKAHRKKSADNHSLRSKAKNIKAKHIGAATKKGRPLPGSKRSKWKKPMNKPAERRA